jgi:hypothetical protein
MGDVSLATRCAASAEMPLLMTKREVVAHLRITERAFNHHMARGTGPTITRVGRKVYVRADHLRAWLDNCADPRLAPGPVPVGSPGEAHSAYVLAYALTGLLRGTVYAPGVIFEMYDNLLLNLEREGLNNPVRAAAHEIIRRTCKEGMIDQVTQQ